MTDLKRMAEAYQAKADVTARTEPYDTPEGRQKFREELRSEIDRRVRPSEPGISRSSAN